MIMVQNSKSISEKSKKSLKVGLNELPQREVHLGLYFGWINRKAHKTNTRTHTHTHTHAITLTFYHSFSFILPLHLKPVQIANFLGRFKLTEGPPLSPINLFWQSLLLFWLRSNERMKFVDWNFSLYIVVSTTQTYIRSVSRIWTCFTWLNLVMVVWF